jgi:hypothetical protein
VAVRNWSTREKRIQTIHGELRLKRSVLKVKHGEEEERKRMKEAVPLDEYLGITGLPFFFPVRRIRTCFFRCPMAPLPYSRLYFGIPSVYLAARYSDQDPGIDNVLSDIGGI